MSTHIPSDTSYGCRQGSGDPVANGHPLWIRIPPVSPKRTRHSSARAQLHKHTHEDNRDPDRNDIIVYRINTHRVWINQHVRGGGAAARQRLPGRGTGPARGWAAWLRPAPPWRVGDAKPFGPRCQPRAAPGPPGRAWTPSRACPAGGLPGSGSRPGCRDGWAGFGPGTGRAGPYPVRRPAREPANGRGTAAESLPAISPVDRHV